MFIEQGPTFVYRDLHVYCVHHSNYSFIYGVHCAAGCDAMEFARVSVTSSCALLMLTLMTSSVCSAQDSIIEGPVTSDGELCVSGSYILYLLLRMRE